ncbi:unnamed protein product [Brassica oleracea var. botrytis]
MGVSRVEPQDFKCRICGYSKVASFFGRWNVSYVTFTRLFAKNIRPQRTSYNCSTTKTHQKSTDKGCWFIDSGFWYMIRFIFIDFVEVFKFVLTLCFLRETKSDLSSESMDGIQPRKINHRIIDFDDVKLVKNIMQMVQYILLNTNHILIAMENIEARKWKGKSKKRKTRRKLRLSSAISFSLGQYSIVAVVDTSNHAGLRKHWKTCVPQEVKDLSEHMVQDFDNEESSNDSKLKRLLSNKLVVAVGASSLSKAISASPFFKIITFKVPASLNLFLTHTHNAMAYALPKSYLGVSALTRSQVLNIHFVSYVNKLTISLAVDATVIPDPHRLCDDLVESLNIIKSTALEKFRIS